MGGAFCLFPLDCELNVDTDPLSEMVAALPALIGIHSRQPEVGPFDTDEVAHARIMILRPSELAEVLY
jgi:hypothetical protein